MDLDAKIKRARFIEKTCAIRETFGFAHPEQIMKAVQIYASDSYGFMLYNFSSTSSESYFRSWNTFVKLAWNVPRDTFTYIVENLLAENFFSLKKQIFSRYTTFFQGLFTSASKEVRHLARIVSRDARSTVFQNVQLIEHSSGLSPWDFSKNRIVDKISKAEVPANNEWRFSLLKSLLDQRMKMESLMENTESLSKMIESLCNS